MQDEDLSEYAVQGFILHELEECSRTVQYFTDKTNNEDRAEISTALRVLTERKEIIRRGVIFSLPTNKDNNG